MDESTPTKWADPKWDLIKVMPLGAILRLGYAEARRRHQEKIRARAEEERFRLTNPRELYRWDVLLCTYGGSFELGTVKAPDQQVAMRVAFFKFGHPQENETFVVSRRNDRFERILRPDD